MKSAKLQATKLQPITYSWIFLLLFFLNPLQIYGQSKNLAGAMLTHTALKKAGNKWIKNIRPTDFPAALKPVEAPLQTSSVAQETVTGTVTDAQTDKPLVGVNILVKGTSIGAATNKKGHYSISAPSLQDTLVFSYIGYKQLTIPIKGRNSINIQLIPATESLNQMVVVGYGTQKRADLTSSIATVDVKTTLSNRPVTNVGNALQGKVAGLTITHSSGRIGAAPDITLRGITGSLNGNGAKPLILVDGVEVPNLNLVDPHDIKSISVLKDAAATAIYGNRAAFGVILIKTKDGIKGQAPHVSYHGSYGWQQPTILPTIAPAPAGARMALLALKRANPSQTSFDVIGMSYSEASIDSIQMWKKRYGGKNLGPEMKKKRDFRVIGGKIYYYRPWDAPKLMTKRWAPLNKQNLSVSGGNENTSYRLGLGYLNQTGIMKASTNSWKRYNINLSLNTSVNSWLDVTGKLKYSLRKKRYPYTQHGSTYNAWYYAYRWPRTYPFGTYQGKPFRNAAADIKQAQPEDNNYNYTRASVSATAKLAPGLSLKGNATYGRQNQVLHATGVPIKGWNNWQGAPLTYSTFTPVTFHHVLYSTYWLSRLNARIELHYKKDFNENSFNVLVGAQPEWYDDKILNGQRDGLLGDRGEFDLATGTEFASGHHYKTTSVGFYGRINYSFQDRYLVQLNGRYAGSAFFPPNHRFGFFPSASAGWILSKESFMNFAKPVLSFLKFRGSWGSVGHLPVRYEADGQIVGGYPYLATLSSTSSGWNIGGSQSEFTFTTPQPISPSLTWEKVTTTDFGADLKFFNNQFTASYDWYSRLTSDMISPGQTLPETFGAVIPKRNYGELRTRGFDLSLGWNHSFSRNFNLHVKGTLSNFHGEITKYANSVHPIPPANPLSVRTHFTGQKLHSIWGYETDRLFQESDFKHNSDGSLMTDASGHYIPNGNFADQSYFEHGSFQYGPGDVKYKDLNGDGVISPCDEVKQKDGSTETICNTMEHHGDLKRIGNYAPHYQYGLTINGNWKGLDFRFFFQGVGSRQVWADGPIFTPGWDPSTAWFAYQTDYWSLKGTEKGKKMKIDYGGGPNAFYPTPTDNGFSTRDFLPQTRYLLHMGYLRMKTVTLGYSLPASLLSQIHIQQLRVYVSAENLFAIDHMRIPVDPETKYNSSASNTWGREYPYHRTITLGIDLKL
jgi:TonB-linked SusC/RagA family outer membrane protein